MAWYIAPDKPIYSKYRRWCCCTNCTQMERIADYKLSNFIVYKQKGIMEILATFNTRLYALRNYLLMMCSKWIKSTRVNVDNHHHLWDYIIQFALIGNFLIRPHASHTLLQFDYSSATILRWRMLYVSQLQNVVLH